MTSPDEAGGAGGTGLHHQLRIVDPRRQLRHSQSLSSAGFPTPPIDIPKQTSSRSPAHWSGLWSGSHEVGGESPSFRHLFRRMSASCCLCVWLRGALCSQGWLIFVPCRDRGTLLRQIRKKRRELKKYAATDPTFRIIEQGQSTQSLSTHIRRLRKRRSKGTEAPLVCICERVCLQLAPSEASRDRLTACLPERGSQLRLRAHLEASSSLRNGGNLDISPPIFCARVL